MTGTAAAAIIANRLGQRTGLDTQILAEMALAQIRLEGGDHLPWFLSYFDTSLVTVAGTKTVALPTGFIRIVDEGGLWLVDSDGKDKYLTKDDYDALRVDDALDETGEPKYYAISGSNVYLFPTPDGAYPLKAHYYKKDAAPAADVENLWLAHAADLLIAETGIPIARFLRDAEAVQLFIHDRQEARARVIASGIARDESGKRSTIGG